MRSWKRASEYGRCAACGKLTERSRLSVGLGGLLLGPECLQKSLYRFVDQVEEEEDDEH